MFIPTNTKQYDKKVYRHIASLLQVSAIFGQLLE